MKLHGEALQELRLVDAVRANAKAVSHRAQQVVRLQLCAHKVGGMHVVPRQALHQFADQRGLAGARPPGDHDETLGAHEGVRHIGTRPGVTLMFVTEAVIGAQPERFSL